MTARVLLPLASLLLASCLARNDLGKQIAPDADGGAVDAGSDAAADAAMDAPLSPLEALEQCLLGVWTPCTEATDAPPGANAMPFAGLTFLPNEKLLLKTCGSGTCQESAGRWKITNIGPDGAGSVAWQVEGAPFPSFFERLFCEKDLLRYELASGWAVQKLQLNRGATPSPCE